MASYRLAWSFDFTSDHFHMLVHGSKSHIPAFTQHLRGNIAKKVGQLRTIASAC